MSFSIIIIRDFKAMQSRAFFYIRYYYFFSKNIENTSGHRFSMEKRRDVVAHSQSSIAYANDSEEK